MGLYIRRAFDLIPRPAIAPRSRDPDFSLTAQRNIDELFRATNGIRILQGASVQAVGIAEQFNRRLNIPTSTSPANAPSEQHDPGEDQREEVVVLNNHELIGSGASGSKSTNGTSFEFNLDYDSAIYGWGINLSKTGGGSITGRVILEVNGSAITTALFNTTTRSFTSGTMIYFPQISIKGQSQGQRVFFNKGSKVRVRWVSMSNAVNSDSISLSVTEKRIKHI